MEVGTLRTHRYVVRRLQTRLHGLAIAHGCNDQILISLFRQTPKAIVEQSIGCWPQGLDRLVSVLPPMILAREAYDLFPKFPELRKFLKFWEEKIEGPLHSVQVAHRELIKPTDLKILDGEFGIN